VDDDQQGVRGARWLPIVDAFRTFGACPPPVIRADFQRIQQFAASFVRSVETQIFTAARFQGAGSHEWEALEALRQLDTPTRTGRTLLSLCGLYT